VHLVGFTIEIIILNILLVSSSAMYNVTDVPRQTGTLLYKYTLTVAQYVPCTTRCSVTPAAHLHVTT